MKQYGLFMTAVFLTCFLLIGCRTTKEADSASFALEDRPLVTEESLLDARETLPETEDTLTAEETSPAEETLPALPEGPSGKIEPRKRKSSVLEPTTQAVDDGPEWIEPTTAATGEVPEYLPLE